MTNMSDVVNNTPEGKKAVEKAVKQSIADQEAMSDTQPDVIYSELEKAAYMAGYRQALSDSQAIDRALTIATANKTIIVMPSLKSRFEELIHMEWGDFCELEKSEASNVDDVVLCSLIRSCADTELNTIRLTKRQSEVYDYIKSFADDYGCTPTLHDIAEHFGYKGVSSAQRPVDALKHAGLVARKGHKLLLLATPLNDRMEDET